MWGSQCNNEDPCRKGIRLTLLLKQIFIKRGEKSVLLFLQLKKIRYVLAVIVTEALTDSEYSVLTQQTVCPLFPSCKRKDSFHVAEITSDEKKINI